MADNQMTPAPGIVLVVPEDGERKVGVIAVAGAPGGENVATGTVTAVGPPRGDGDGDLAVMVLERDVALAMVREKDDRIIRLHNERDAMTARILELEEEADELFHTLEEATATLKRNGLA